MNVDESFLLEAFPLVWCPNLTSLLCSFHPTTDYSAPPWFHLPCVYWLRCSPFARFGKSEGFGSYGSLVRFESVRLWASLLLSLLPLNGFFFPRHLIVMTPLVCCHLLSTQIPLLNLPVHVHSDVCDLAFVSAVFKHRSDFAGLCQGENLKVSRSPVASTFVKEWSLVQKEEQRQKLVLGWRCLRAFKELSDGRKPDSLGWTSAWTLFSWCLEGTRPCWCRGGCFSAGTEQSGPQTVLKAQEVFIFVITLRAIIKENVEKNSGNFHRLYFMFRVTQQFWWHRGTLRSPQRWHTFCKQVQDASYMIN